MKQRMAVSVRGRQHDWTFFFDGDPEYVEDWRADGLEILDVASVEEQLSEARKEVIPSIADVFERHPDDIQAAIRQECNTDEARMEREGALMAQQRIAARERA